MKLPGRICTVVFLVWGVATLASLQGASSPDEQTTPAEDLLRITQFLDGNAERKDMVIINGGSQDGIIDGATFKSYRLSRGAPPAAAVGKPDGFWVETGLLKAFRVEDTYTLASVVKQGTIISKAFFPRFPGIMAGDLIRENRVELTKVQQLTPTLSLTFHDLFEDPKGRPTTYELTARGLKKIKEAASQFTHTRIGTLFVEGHTDLTGPSAQNQVESYQRAMVIKQLLVDKMGFDPSRVVAVGFGETEPRVDDYVPGHRQINRRIVLKAIEDDPLQ